MVAQSAHRAIVLQTLCLGASRTVHHETILLLPRLCETTLLATITVLTGIPMVEGTAMITLALLEISRLAIRETTITQMRLHGCLRRLLALLGTSTTTGDETIAEAPLALLALLRPMMAALTILSMTAILHMLELRTTVLPQAPAMVMIDRPMTVVLHPRIDLGLLPCTSRY